MVITTIEQIQELAKGRGIDMAAVYSHAGYDNKTKWRHETKRHKPCSDTLAKLYAALEALSVNR